MSSGKDDTLPIIYHRRPPRERHTCWCGAPVYIETDGSTLQTYHALPVCTKYLELCEEHGGKLDDRLAVMVESDQVDEN